VLRFLDKVAERFLRDLERILAISALNEQPKRRGRRDNAEVVEKELFAVGTFPH